MSAMKCPQCCLVMEDGYIPTAGGLFWFRKGQRLTGAAVEFAKRLPGTFTWFRRAKLEAYHCPRCQFVLFRYGKHVEEPKQFQHR